MAQQYFIVGQHDIDDRLVFGGLVERQLIKQGITLRELADRLGTSYEFVRRLVRGGTLLSPKRLPKLAKILDYPLDELRQVAMLESNRRRFGAIPATPFVEAETAQLVKLWSQLTFPQKDQFLIQLQAIANSNKRDKRKKNP